MRDTADSINISLEVVGNPGDSVTINTDSDVHNWTQADNTDTNFSDGVIYLNDFADSITLTV